MLSDTYPASIEIMREAMEYKKEAFVPDEAPLWLGDEAKLVRLYGIR